LWTYYRPTISPKMQPTMGDQYDPASFAPSNPNPIGGGDATKTALVTLIPIPNPKVSMT
jgi:hypothetical protein